MKNIMKKYKPVTPAMRGTILIDTKNIVSKTKRNKSLTAGRKRAVGRNSKGRITMRHRGGGHKKVYRKVDFLQTKFDIPAKVETIEYDPNRSSFISLVCFKDGERRYILTPSDVKVGDVLEFGEKVAVKPGNRMMIKNIPSGTNIYNIEIKSLGGAKLVRSAGQQAVLLGHDGSFAQIKLPSQEVRKIHIASFASIGSVSNKNHRLKVLGKAGRSRWMGRRPKVRGSAMNPVDHPYGGGEQKQGRGRKRAVTKWGKPSGKGQKTRKPKRYSDPHIVRRRHLAKKR